VKLSKKDIKKRLIEFIESTEIQDFRINYNRDIEINDLCKVVKKYKPSNLKGAITAQFKIKAGG
jgi:hypothetical protein